MFPSLCKTLFAVSDDKVFEFSDYTWGLLIHLSKVSHSSHDFSQTVSFICNTHFQTLRKFIISTYAYE